MRTSYRRGLSALAALALVLGSALVATPAHADPADPAVVTVNSPTDGDTVSGFTLDATIADEDLWWWAADATGPEYHVIWVGTKENGPYANPTNINVPVDTSSWLNGVYTVRLGAYDHSGNTPVTELQITVTNGVAHNRIDSPSEGQYISGDVSVTGRLSYAAPDYSFYQLDSEPAVYLPNVTSTGAQNFSFTLSGLSEGPHTLLVSAGPGEGIEVTRSFIVDNTAPVISVNDSYFGLPGTTSIDAVAWISDNSPVHYDLRSIYTPNYIDFYVRQNVLYPGGAIIEPFDTTGWIEDDLGHAFAIYAVDAAGNSDFVQVPMGIDGENPKVTFTQPDAGALITDSTVIRGKVTDAASGPQWVEVSVHPLRSNGTCNVNSTVGTPAFTWVSDDKWSVQLGAGAPADGEYCLRAVAADYVGNLDTARVLPVTIDSTAPATPTPIAPEGWVLNAKTFEWTESTDDNGVTYEFTVDVNADFSTELRLQELTENSLELWSFEPGTYWWKVRAIDGAGNKSPWSDKVKFNVIGKPVVCACIDNFSDLLSFHWSEVNGPGGIDHYDYRIQYEGDPSDSGDDEVINGEVDGTIYWVDQVFDDTMAQGEWTIRVRAVYNHRLDPADPGSKTGPWSRPVTVIHDSIAPDAPELLTPDDEFVTNDTDFWFTWAAQAGDDRYRFRMSETSGAVDGNGRLIDATGTGLNHPGHEAGVIAEGEYWWQVRAIDEAGNRGAWSEVRHLIVDYTAPTAVNLVSLTNGTTVKNSKVSFDWDAVIDDVNYVIELSKSPAVNGTGSLQTLAYLGTGLVSSKLDNLNLANGTYYWHVRAVDAAGNLGPWSQLWTVKVAVPAAANTAFTGTETVVPTDEPTDEPSDEPTDEPTDEPSDEPTEEPSASPSDSPEAAGAVDGFPVWIIIGIVIVVLVGGGFLIRFLLRRA